MDELVEADLMVGQDDGEHAQAAVVDHQWQVDHAANCVTDGLFDHFDDGGRGRRLTTDVGDDARLP